MWTKPFGRGWRWRIGKVFDTGRNKLEETKGWATGEVAQDIRTHFFALTHNLLVLLRRQLEVTTGIREEKVETKRRKALKKREIKARESGRKVADSLVDGNVFNWKPVPTAEEADAGVSSGKYAFALKIPAEFSTNLVSPGSFDSASKAMLNVTTNDANNYLLSTIVDKLTTAVHTTVAKEVGEETANQLLTGFGTIHAHASGGLGCKAE